MPRTDRRAALALLASTLAGCGSVGDPGTTTTDGAATTGATTTAGTPTNDPSESATPSETSTETATPPPERYDVLEDRDLTFRETDARPLALDLYRPARETPAPLLVHVHGGGWRFGDKGYRRSARRYAAAGIATASIQYRLSDEATFPDPVRDVVAAVRWLRANADEFGLDPERVALVGGSAGGHLASLVAAAPDDERFHPPEFYPDVPVAVDAVVGHSGVYDMTAPGLRSSRLVTAFVGTDYDEAPETYRAASPVDRAASGDPPVLLFHGTADGIVPYDQATRYRERLQSASVPVDLFTGDGAGHVFYTEKRWFEPTLARQYDFLAERLSLD